MVRIAKRISGLLTLVLLLGLASGRTPAADGPGATADAWRKDVRLLGPKVAEVLGKSKVPVELEQSTRDKHVLRHKVKKDTGWVVFRDAQEGEFHAELAKALAGRVSWRGVVEDVMKDSPKKGRIFVRMTLPAEGLPANVQMRPVGTSFPEYLFKAGGLPTVGKELAFTGTIETPEDSGRKGLLADVVVYYGFGENAGKVQIAVLPSNSLPEP